MGDLRKLRKLNQLKNKANPIVPEESKGGLGNRDPNTGKRRTKLDNGGTYPATELFNSSVGGDTQVQLNANTKTADYRSRDVEGDRRDEGVLKRKVKVATGRPNPEIKDETDPDEINPNNPNFGNCEICSGVKATSLNCVTGKAKITFADNRTETIITPAEIEYGAKVVFGYEAGGSGGIYVNACGNVVIEDGNEPPDIDPFDPSIYGKVIYSQNATAIDIGIISGSNLKAFQFYQKNCTVTVVGIDENGNKRVLGATTCSNLDGSYTIATPTNCVIVGNEKRCGVDLNSIQYQCVVRGYRLCQKYRVAWTIFSSGEATFFEDCDPLSYRIVDIEDTGGYSPGARPVGEGVLRYNSGIPKKFTVNGALSSGDYGFFQIYQSTENPCQYEVVGVKVQGDRDVFSGAVSNNEYATIYTGGCGFQIALGDYVSDKALQILDSNGAVIFETFDFIVGSVSVGRSPDVTRVAEFEKTVNSGTSGGVGIRSIECVP